VASAATTFPRAGTVLVVFTGIVITVLGLRELAWLVAPAAFALFIVILVHPVYTGLVRRGVPAVAALAALLLSVFGVILGLVAIVVYAIARLATILPGCFDEAAATTRELSAHLASLGVGREQIREIVRDIDLPVVAGWLTTHIPSVVSVATSLVLVYSLLLFVGIDTGQGVIV
jgi:AI-2 transport protein TqsA